MFQKNFQRLWFGTSCEINENEDQDKTNENVTWKRTLSVAPSNCHFNSLFHQATTYLPSFIFISINDHDRCRENDKVKLLIYAIVFPDISSYLGYAAIYQTSTGIISIHWNGIVGISKVRKRRLIWYLTGRDQRSYLCMQ